MTNRCSNLQHLTLVSQFSQTIKSLHRVQELSDRERERNKWDRGSSLERGLCCYWWQTCTDRQLASTRLQRQRQHHRREELIDERQYDSTGIN